MTLPALADDLRLDRAFDWLCRTRRHFPEHADVWSLRARWLQENRRPQAELRSRRFRFGLLERVTLKDDSRDRERRSQSSE